MRYWIENHHLGIWISYERNQTCKVFDFSFLIHCSVLVTVIFLDYIKRTCKVV